MIQNLLPGKHGKLQLWIVMFGSFIGLSLVMISTQLYFDFKNFLTVKSDFLSEQFITVNKKVNVLNTLLNSKSTFSQEEISTLENMPQVKQVAGFVSNRFRLKTSIQFAGQQLYSDLFFEAVPDTYLDIQPNNWEWDSVEGIIPIILPADYLNLYNFGFAPGQGLPQLTPDMISMATLQIQINGAGKERIFKGKIVGFSNRINSILVPLDFMQYANRNFSDALEPEPSRLIVASDNPADPALMKYFDEQGYELNNELLKNSKMQSLMRIILTIVLFLSAIIIALSLTGFVQFSRLLINKKEYEIRILYYLGYTHRFIASKYLIFYLRITGIVFVLSLLSLFVVQYFFGDWMTHKGFELESSIQLEAIFSGFALFAILVITGAWDIFRVTKKLAKS